MCGREPGRRLLWLRVRCEIVCSSRARFGPTSREGKEAAARITDGKCAGQNCAGCYFRSLSIDGERVRYYPA